MVKAKASESSVSCTGVGNRLDRSQLLGDAARRVGQAAIEFQVGAVGAPITVSGQWAVGSVSLRLRFGPHFTPLCFSILDQFEKELSASRICPFCVKLLLQVILRGKEAQRIAHFVGQPVSECINTPANRADRNELVLFVSYARLGAHIAPTDVPTDGCEKCVSQLRGYWFVHGHHRATLVDLRPRKPVSGAKAERQRSAQSVTPKHPSTSAIGYLQHQIKLVREAPAYRSRSSLGSRLPGLPTRAIKKVPLCVPKIRFCNSAASLALCSIHLRRSTLKVGEADTNRLLIVSLTSN